jgi:translation elongation factor EF-Tu-like GTPase
MPIEDVFSITGRGTVATGRIESGVINTGDITINGNDYDDEYEVNEHAKKHLVIDSGLGDIEVKY